MVRFADLRSEREPVSSMQGVSKEFRAAREALLEQTVPGFSRGTGPESLSFVWVKTRSGLPE